MKTHIGLFIFTILALQFLKYSIAFAQSCHASEINIEDFSPPIDFAVSDQSSGVIPGSTDNWIFFNQQANQWQSSQSPIKGDIQEMDIATNLQVGLEMPQKNLHGLVESKLEPGREPLLSSTPDSCPELIFFAPNGHRRDIRFRNEGIQILTRNDSASPINENGINIDENGNVGIGTFFPVSKLDVKGTSRTEILQITGGADLAESFQIVGSEKVIPGMVVAIDPQHSGRLRIADSSYDHMVAGCVSGANGIQPGLTMQQDGTVASGAFPVALTGRVYCLADASQGAILPGDLLTTSATPGYAMVASDYDQAIGAIIGKAMSSLPSGRGLILVLVTLQ